ncbi:MAG: LLM class flavin-dependent oxidoreductase [Candidatus Binatia bacterium]
MRFGTYHTFQCPPWLDEHEVFFRETERLRRAEALGYDDVWVPEQHFTP